MENNQTINLGNNVGGVQPPVFGGNVIPPTQTVFGNNSVQTQVVQSPVIPVKTEENVAVTVAPADGEVTIQMPQQDISIQQNMHLETGAIDTTTVDTDEQTSVVTEPTVIDNSDSFTLPTVVFRELLSIAVKVGVSMVVQPKTEILTIFMNNNGIVLRATNGNEDIEIVNKRYVFTNPLTLSLSIKTLYDFVNAISSTTLTFSYDAEHRIVTVVTDDNSGTYKFPERRDPSTNQTVIHELKYDMSYADMKPVNYQDFMKVLAATKDVRAFAGQLNEDLQGTYFSDVIVSSDSVVMLMSPNNLGIGDPDFFLPTGLCNLLITIPFDAEKFRVGFISNPQTNVIEGIVISDESITMCSKISIPQKFPIMPSKQFWSLDDFDYKITIPVGALTDVLKPILVFVDKSNGTKDKIRITISGNDMVIRDINGGAEQHIPITNENGLVCNEPFELPASKFYSILQSVKSDSIDIFTNDPKSSAFMCLKYDEYKCMIAYLKY